ncbi:ROK family transcriptional regulator [Bailinhaonella thermotolerans]|uniref:ROK family transcriptional regulator n=1 Tax=Bailinhaonella thermotolerans TaxID=1070861 RepID=A0A3A4B0Z6_9ACTN|nr:ROK family transcriptional regulator [Bailinhaonella thermotolerans]RJL35395.1 ROK family transcriptional regulator [Bailinhaonella thermotolerans]
MEQVVPGTPSRMRAINDRAALETLLERGPLTRPQIAALMGISKPTASQLLARLQEAGLVVLDGFTRGDGPGRTAERYRVNPEAAHVAGLDVDPGRILVRVADLAGNVAGEHRLATPGRSGGDVVARVREAIAGACAAAGLGPGRVRRAVIGIQGALDPRTGRLGYAAHIPGWHVPRLAATLREGLGVPVDIENDVNLVAQAEQAHGAARGVDDFALLWAADGLGMAVVVGGRLYRGATGGAGEIGYMTVPGAPTRRDAGRGAGHGLQSLAGGPAIHKVMRAHGFRGHPSPAAAVRAAARLLRPAAPQAPGSPGSPGSPVPPGDGRTAGASRTGEGGRAAERREAVWRERASAALEEVARRMAAGLAPTVSVLDPALVVLAGDVLLAGGEPLRALVEREVHALTVPRPPLRLSRVEGNGVLAGALDLALAAVRNEVFGSTL